MSSAYPELSALAPLPPQNPSRLVLGCVFLLGGLRPFALLTTHLSTVYLLYVPMVIALGTINTTITAACSRLAPAHELGGLFGVLEAVEAVAGMVGPALGGLLATSGEGLALASVCVCYGLTFALVVLTFDKWVVRPTRKAAE